MNGQLRGGQWLDLLTEGFVIDVAEADALETMGEEIVRELGGAFCYQL